MLCVLPSCTGHPNDASATSCRIIVDLTFDDAVEHVERPSEEIFVGGVNLVCQTVVVWCLWRQQDAIEKDIGRLVIRLGHVCPDADALGQYISRVVLQPFSQGIQNHPALGALGGQIDGDTETGA